MNKYLQTLVVKLSPRHREKLKKYQVKRQIARGEFHAGEPEYDNLDGWVSEGDHVIDIGANIGHYTAKLSDLVGANGRVYAFEPVPRTFTVLAELMSYIGAKNISLFNCAVSDRVGIVSMSIPNFESGLENYYQAKIGTGHADIQVFSMNIDALEIPEKISLIKIDVEGHEYSTLVGMVNLLRRDKPRLIVESGRGPVEELLTGLHYQFEEVPGSPNRVFFADQCLGEE